MVAVKPDRDGVNAVWPAVRLVLTDRPNIRTAAVDTPLHAVRSTVGRSSD